MYAVDDIMYLSEERNVVVGRHLVPKCHVEFVPI